MISHIFTAANYEYCVYWNFMQDGVVQLDIKLTGILNTYAMRPGEDASPWGTQVYPNVNGTLFAALQKVRSGTDRDLNSTQSSTYVLSPCRS